MFALTFKTETTFSLHAVYFFHSFVDIISKYHLTSLSKKSDKG